MKRIVEQLCAALTRGERVATGVIVRQDGSAPRGPGARLLADQNGLLCGTVGGGLAEARVLDLCREALTDGKPRLLAVDMDGKLAAGADMICGGRVLVLVEPLSPEDLPLFEAVRGVLAAPWQSSGGRLCVSLQNFARSFVTANGGAFGAPLPQPFPAVEGEYPTVVQAGTAGAEGDWFVEPIVFPWRLVLAGGGHVSRPTAHMGALLDFAVTVLDDRADFATPERFPDAAQTLTVPDFVDCFAACPPDARTCVVILTRGHVHDAAVLEQALRSKAGYIGMIGSTRKRNQVYVSLQEKGFSAAELQRVHCPVGLPINAQTPEEIAVSILAECIAHRRGPGSKA